MPESTYKHDRMKPIRIRIPGVGIHTLFELTNLPEHIHQNTERVFITVPFRNDEVPMIEEGLTKTIEWAKSNHRKMGGYTVIQATEDGATHINVCMGCVHKMLSEQTGSHPENASDEEVAKAVLCVAFREPGDSPCQN